LGTLSITAADVGAAGEGAELLICREQTFESRGKVIRSFPSLAARGFAPGSGPDGESAWIRPVDTDAFDLRGRRGPLHGYEPAGFDEMFDPAHGLRPHYEKLHARLAALGEVTWSAATASPT